ncbi:MAG TPA: hypothetical protein VEJ42_02145 [Streptosporangiaceae bacterium]|nr:hypothetical protein [Streptosporangiaceae bacterium]
MTEDDALDTTIHEPSMTADEAEMLIFALPSTDLSARTRRSPRAESRARPHGRLAAPGTARQCAVGRDRLC